MARTRLRKKNRVAQAGKGCHTAQYGFGTTKREDKVFGHPPKESPESIGRWAEAHTRQRVDHDR